MNKHFSYRKQKSTIIRNKYLLPMKILFDINAFFLLMNKILYLYTYKNNLYIKKFTNVYFISTFFLLDISFNRSYTRRYRDFRYSELIKELFLLNKKRQNKIYRKNVTDTTFLPLYSLYKRNLYGIRLTPFFFILYP